VRVADSGICSSIEWVTSMRSIGSYQGVSGHELLAQSCPIGANAHPEPTSERATRSCARVRPPPRRDVWAVRAPCAWASSRPQPRSQHTPPPRPPQEIQVPLLTTGLTRGGGYASACARYRRYLLTRLREGGSRQGGPGVRRGTYQAACQDVQRGLQVRLQTPALCCQWKGQPG